MFIELQFTLIESDFVETQLILQTFQLAANQFCAKETNKAIVKSVTQQLNNFLLFYVKTFILL